MPRIIPRAFTEDGVSPAPSSPTPKRWRPYWKKKRPKDRRQTSFSFIERPKRAIPVARRRQLMREKNTPCAIYFCEKPAAALDHVCPVRLAALCPTEDPHDERNLMPVCVSHNNTKKKAERMLAAGNKLGFLQYLRERNWPMDTVDTALKLYGWC